MTKEELFYMLASVPDDAEVFIMGADISVMVYSSKDNEVVLDEKGSPFEDGVRNGYYRVLFDDDGAFTEVYVQS
jgi:hypothetical protein